MQPGQVIHKVPFPFFEVFVLEGVFSRTMKFLLRDVAQHCVTQLGLIPSFVA
jgi:hypothetical protein